MAARLTSITTAYLTEQFSERREQVLAEQVFLMESLRDERLADLARSYRSAWIAGLEQILHRLDSPAPARDASLLVSVVLGLGFDTLLNRRIVDSKNLEQSVHRIICMILWV